MGAVQMGRPDNAETNCQRGKTSRSECKVGDGKKHYKWTRQTGEKSLMIARLSSLVADILRYNSLIYLVFMLCSCGPLSDN